MTALRVSSIAELLNASSDDRNVLQFDVRDAPFGYHAQQAVEKLLKALISAHGVAYPFIHDLVALRKLLEKQGEVLPLYVTALEKLTSFAGQFRYEQPVHLDAMQRKQVREWMSSWRRFA
jgi:hypothetical protein